MNYTLNQLQVFLKVVQCESVTKAAEELHLTQPAVSIQLRNFQDQFDVALTEVISRKIYITAFGREIAVAAEKIIQEVQAINYMTLEYKGRLTGRLKISSVSTGKYVIPFLLTDFIKDHSGVELSIDVTNKKKVIESLEKNEIDFALVSVLPSQMNIEKLDLLQIKLFLVGNSKAAIESGVKSQDAFQELPLIFREKGSTTRQTMEGFLKNNNVAVQKKMELTSNEAVKQAIMAGLGYSIMPLIGIKNELSNNELRIIPMKGLPITTNWSLIWLKGKKHSPVSLAFLDHLKRTKNQIISQRFSWYEKY
ncbi:LysR family transcriptional regulator [Flavobacteriaceae bacterium]|nr:LysR family transcriptional regulator [Flavobacteriaceae bacterium]